MGEKEGKSPTEVITAFHRCTGRNMGSYYSGPEYFGIQNKRIQKKLAKRYAQASRTERVRDKRRHAAQERKAKLAKKKEEEKEKRRSQLAAKSVQKTCTCPCPPASSPNANAVSVSPTIARACIDCECSARARVHCSAIGGGSPLDLQRGKKRMRTTMMITQMT